MNYVRIRGQLSWRCCGARQQVVGDPDVWDHFFKVGENVGMGIIKIPFRTERTILFGVLGGLYGKTGGLSLFI